MSWIPVSTRKPEAERNVLVFSKWDLCVYTAVWNGHSWKHFCGDDSAKYTIREVTHWMQTPGEPK